MNNSHQKGFTLLELLVVIAVIGILAGVVLIVVGNARNKAKDAAAIKSIKQFEILLQQEYSDTGSYIGLQSATTTFYTANDCDTMFTASQSKYASDARNICKSILQNVYAFTLGHIRFNQLDQKYSISTSLNMPIYYYGYASGHDYCVGSSGTYNGTSMQNSHQGQKGCLNNP